MARKAKDKSEDVLLVTQAGYDEMVIELEDRKKKTEEIAAEIDEARNLGDLKENEPYAAAMQKKELNDTRIDELEYLISIAQIVESDSKGAIGIGNTVEIQKTADKSTKTVTLVGRQASQEANPAEGKVSVDSPIGKAISGAHLGDLVEVDLPIGKVQYKIVKVIS